MITLGAIIGVAILAVIVHVFRFISKCNDEQHWIAMKSKTERRNKWTS